jgi:sec-independent protein translocase protein TatC
MSLSSMPPPTDPLRPFLDEVVAETAAPPSTVRTLDDPSPWVALQTAWTTQTLPHIEELRWRLALCALAIAGGAGLGWWLAPGAIHTLQHVAPSNTVFVQIAPGEAFLAVIKVALILGALSAAPVCLYQIARFLLPGLTRKERRWLVCLMVGAVALFGVGVALAAWLLLPTALSLLLSFGEGLAVPQISLATYLDTCVMLLGLTGLLCQLPLVLLVIMGLGWVSSAQVLSRWRELLVAVLVIAAVITPTWDPLTLALISLPLLGLLALTLGVARLLRW